MSYKILFTPEAKQEFEKAYNWYEEQSDGLGKKFSNHVEEALISLANPLVDYKIIFKNQRRVLLRKFPYALYYRRHEKIKVVVVTAILHDRQSKDVLKHRI